MATAARKLAPYEHVLSSDQEAAKKTTFNLRPLNGLEYLHAGELLRKGTHAECYEYVLKRALLGWSGLVDESGADVPFTLNASENLNRLTSAQCSELAASVLDNSELTEDERKN